MALNSRNKRVSRPEVQSRRDAARQSRTHYGLDELAARMGVSEETIRDLVTQRELAVIRFKRRLLVDRQSWERWLERNTVPAK